MKVSYSAVAAILTQADTHVEEIFSWKILFPVVTCHVPHAPAQARALAPGLLLLTRAGATADALSV